MTNEQAKTLTDNALSRLMDDLSRGQSDALRNYLAAMSRFHQYSLGNCLLIFSQRPNATHVAGFHTWLKLGRHVRKGEKGILILAPMVGRKRTNGELTEDEQTRLYGFRGAHVFDCSQTEGKSLPEFPTVKGDPQGYLARLERFVGNHRISLNFSESIAPARGMSHGGVITLLPAMPPAEVFSVLVHETAHELLHKSERRSQTTHTIRETEAEAVAFVVASAIGLDTDTANSDYILLHRGDKTALAESLGIIQETSSLILRAIQPTAATNNHIDAGP